MIRNAIQMLDRVSELNDRVKSPRYTDRQYMNALNQATEAVITKRLDPMKTGDMYSFQSIQRLRDELKSLIPPAATGSPTADVVPFPNLYKYYGLLYVNINGVKTFVRPTSYNQEGELFKDPFSLYVNKVSQRGPEEKYLYFNETAAGLRILHESTTTLGTYELWYVKQPNVIYIGEERDKRTSVTGILNTTSYTVYEEAVHNSITYYSGEVFTSVSTVLTSGVVIPTSIIVNSDLPSTLQDEICNVASTIMSDEVENYNKKLSLGQTVDKY